MGTIESVVYIRLRTGVRKAELSEVADDLSTNESLHEFKSYLKLSERVAGS